MRVMVVSADQVERLRATTAMDVGAFDIVDFDTIDEARPTILGDAQGYDVLVVDGDLAPRGGYAFLYELRGACELAGRPPVPSVILASRTSDRWLADWAGASAMLLKPVAPFDVVAAVRSAATSGVPEYGDKGSAAAQVGSALRLSGR
jgi:DNA-binding response OmpR family regulator